MKKLLILFILTILLAGLTFGQDAKFGGPFTAFSYNKHGLSLSVGGGGTFLIKEPFYIGIFGQGTTDAFERKGDIGYENYVLKSRQTGFWFGYNHYFKAISKMSVSLYNKVGFGQVMLNNPKTFSNFYDKSVVLTPNAELSYRLTSFFEIGVAAYYEIFTGVDLFHYRSIDFNSIGASFLFKFKKTE